MVENETKDLFHRGRFCLVQPLGRGHRSGIDAMILAASVPNDFSGTLVDLGSGAGAAGFAVLSRCAAATVTLVEFSPLMIDFAKKTLAHPRNSLFKERVNIIIADVTLTGGARRETGLTDNQFDFAIMNPPFNLNTDRASADQETAKAHRMHEGLFEAWLRTASAIVRPKGGLALIARPSSIAEILSAFDGRFGGIKLIPILPRRTDPAIRTVLVATKSSRAHLQIMPPLILHQEHGNGFLPEADAINNGKMGLWEAIQEKNKPREI